MSDEKNVWDSVWKRDVYSAEELRELKAEYKINRLLNKVEITMEDKVLDIGCGGGYLSRSLYSKTKAKTYGIDSSPVAIGMAKYKSEGLPIFYALGNATELRMADNSVDAVMCVGVIEHIKDYNKCFKEITRVLKPKGLIYVVFSNKHSFIYQQRLLKEALGCWKYGYQENWSKDKLENELKSEGFKTISMEVDNGIGDFKLIDILDRAFSFFGKKRGRYIYYIGRLNG